jgi:uncharacterized protein DUF6882
MPHPPLDALFLAHVGPALAKHLALLHAVEGLPCHADLKRGDVRFGDRYTFPIQLLGVETQQTQTWTWSWDLPATIVARPLTRAARDLKAWGEAQDLDLFFVPNFQLSNLSGDQIAILSCGLSQSAAFLIMETSLGRTFFLLPDLVGQIPSRHAAAFLPTVFREMLSTYSLPDYRAATRSLLHFEGFELDESHADTWHARRADGSHVTVGFDPQGRVAQLNVETGPSPG